jgi:hypothetical protein
MASFTADESIFNLIPKVLPAIVKPPQYVSIHDPKQQVSHSTNNRKAPNMGLSQHEGIVNRPDNYLRKNAGLPAMDGSGGRKKTLAPLNNSGNNKENIGNASLSGSGGKHASLNKYDALETRKPLVPRRDDGNPVLIRKGTEKNFITANAVEAILRVPVAKADNAPDYLRKPDYGQVPQYLSEVKKEIDEENELIDAFVKQQMNSYADAPEYCEAMNNGERLELIEKLKIKWDKVNKSYQVLCMHTIFEGNAKYTKEAYEKQMSEIESDLGKLMVNGDVMIDYAN